MAGSTKAIKLPLLPEISGQRVGSFRVGTTIESVPYVIDGRWNSRANYDPRTRTWSGAWFLDFYESDLTPIVLGMKVVLGAYLGRRSNHRLFTDGVLVAVDLANSGRDATYDDFGVRVVVEWIPVLELLRRLRATAEAGV